MEVIAYKSFYSDMTLDNYVTQFEIGKKYYEKSITYAFEGFLNPQDCIMYSFNDKSLRYLKIKLSGEITKTSLTYTDCTAVKASEMTILEEIDIDKTIKKVEWWKNDGVLELLDYRDGFALIQRGDMLYNFIDKDGKILSIEWFTHCKEFKDGFARVLRKDELYNFIDTNGKFLSNEWFNFVFEFNEGYAVVRNDVSMLYNFIDKNGKYLFDNWFDYAFVSNFEKGFARVQRTEDELWNFMDKEGNYLSDEWFEYVTNFDNNGIAIVTRAGDLTNNFITTYGVFLTDVWFKNVYGFNQETAIVVRTEDNLENYIDIHGNYLSDEWFKYAEPFSDNKELARVIRTNDEDCKIDKTGKLWK